MSDESVQDRETDDFRDPFAEQIVLFLAAATLFLVGFAYWTHNSDPLTGILSAFTSGLVGIAYWQKARPAKLNRPSPWLLLLTHSIVRVFFVIVGSIGVVYGFVIGISHPTLLVAAIAVFGITTGAVALLLWNSLR